MKETMKHLIIGLALIVSAFTASATQQEFCDNLAIHAKDIQLKRQHRQYDYVDAIDYMSYQHHLLVNMTISDTAKETVREQYVYLSNSVYNRPYILNPRGMYVQVYHDCMNKNDWDHQK
jgi:hypothetical protein